MKRYYVIILMLWFIGSCLNGYMDYLDFYRNIPCNLQPELWIFKDIWHTVKFGTLLCITGIALFAMFPPFTLARNSKPTWITVSIALAILAILNYIGHELFLHWIW